MTAKRLLIRKTRVIIVQGARTNRILRKDMNAAISLVELRITSQLKGKPGKPKAHFAGEYTMSGYIKKRFDGFKDDPNKIGIFSGKWILQTVQNFGTR